MVVVTSLAVQITESEVASDKVPISDLRWIKDNEVY